MQQQSFGTLEGRPVSLYVLENAHGLRVKLTDYGAGITSVSVPGEDGNRVELVAGFDTLEGYFSDAYNSNAPYFGGTIGRYASRIKDGKFTVGGREYFLATNDGSNHLHGGLRGFDKRIWTAEPLDDRSVRFTLRSPDGEEGYPGNLDVSVTYRLTDDSDLVMTYGGVTDAPTPLSLTNHAYFNLSGFTETIHRHTVRIDAEEFLTPDETNIPVGHRTPVDHHASDLREEAQLARALEAFPTGFEHYYAFSTDGGKRTYPTAEAREVARFTHPSSERSLTVLTTEPGALFYTGYFTSDELQRENGDRYGRYRAFCFEASRFPNGPNLGEANSILQPGEPYAAETVYRFDF